MGSGTWSPRQWANHQQSTVGKSQAQIFTQSGMHADLDPRNIKVRESVDSTANPNSTPIMIFVDQTGSMGVLAEQIIKHGLGVIVEQIHSRKPVTDPHILIGAIGDGKNGEAAPLQASQFEAEVAPITTQVQNIFLEADGGGNGGESYIYAWYFAAMKTSCDAIRKRGQKGFLFTIGDEPPHLNLTRQEITRYFGDSSERDYTAEELLELASQSWEVFHLIVHPGTYEMDRWKALLGERAIKVSDHTKLAEVIVSTLQVLAGHDIDAVASSWSGDTSIVVRDAVGALAKAGAAGSDVVRL